MRKPLCVTARLGEAPEGDIVPQGGEGCASAGEGGGAGRGDVAAATACFDLRPAGRPTTGLAALFCLLPAAGL